MESGHHFPSSYSNTVSHCEERGDLAGRLDTNKVLHSSASSKRERLSVALEGPGGTLVLFLATSSCCHSYGKVQLSLDEALVF